MWVNDNNTSDHSIFYPNNITTVNTILGLALDMDNRLVTFYKNNLQEGNPVSIPSGATIYPVYFIHVATLTFNFSSSSLFYTNME